MRKFGPYERSEEINGFASDFLSAVHKGDVSSNEHNGGGYALTSQIRDNHHIPTSTAAQSLRLSAEQLLEDLRTKGATGQEAAIHRNVQRAFETVSAAHRLLTGPGCKLSGAEKDHVLAHTQPALLPLQSIAQHLAKLAR